MPRGLAWAVFLTVDPEYEGSWLPLVVWSDVNSDAAENKHLVGFWDFAISGARAESWLHFISH